MFVCAVTGMAATLLGILSHYEVLRRISDGLDRSAFRPRGKMVLVVFGAFLSHILHIVIFASFLVALSSGYERYYPGRTLPSNWAEATYVSIESYASLGGNEAFPFGPLRLFCGIEALAGLVFVGWTSAFTYLVMTRLWNEH